MEDKIKSGLKKTNFDVFHCLIFIHFVKRAIGD
jgi:hypothetical protein